MSTDTSAPPGQQAADGARQVTDQAQEKAQQAASQAQGKLREQLDQRSMQAAEQVNQQAADLRAVSDSLREQGKDGPASAADRLAEYAEKIGGYLRDKDSDAMLSDAEDFGRRQPWAVGAGALALGFAASRFLKASSSDRYSSRYGGQSRPAGQRSSQHPPQLGGQLAVPPTAAGVGVGALPPAPPLPQGSSMGSSTLPLGSTPPTGRAPGV
jgi:hypothetical protein